MLTKIDGTYVSSNLAKNISVQIEKIEYTNMLVLSLSLHLEHCKVFSSFENCTTSGREGTESCSLKPLKILRTSFSRNSSKFFFIPYLKRKTWSCSEFDDDCTYPFLNPSQITIHLESVNADLYLELQSNDSSSIELVKSPRKFDLFYILVPLTFLIYYKIVVKECD